MNMKHEDLKKTYDRERMETFLKTLSTKDFLQFGMHHVAYVRPVKLHGEDVFAIHAADGTPLSVSETFDSAITMVKDNDLEAVTVH